MPAFRATVLFLVFAKSFPVDLVASLLPLAVRAGIVWAGPIAGLVFWGVVVFRNSAFPGLPATPQRR
jgi:hypothetical protein